MTADLPRDPTTDPALVRLVASLDQAAERAGGQRSEPSQPDDALVAAIVAQLQAPESWTAPPDHLRAAILAEAASSPARGPAPTAVPSPAPTSERVIQLVPRWRRMAWAVPVAAATAVVFTLLVLGGERLLTSPDNGISYALAAGPEGRNASGTVSISAAAAGFPVVLDVHNLPGAPTGYYYEAWLSKPGQGNPVSLGTFHGRRNGGPIKLWSGVDPAGCTLNIDLESLTDGPGPSGQVYLTAKIVS